MIVNLTPHAVTVRMDNGDVVIPPSGQIARVSTSAIPAGEVLGIPVVRTAFGVIENLPEPQDNVFYLVSKMVAQAAAEIGRSDVFAPDTGPQSAIRNAEGQIIAVRRFQIF